MNKLYLKELINFGFSDKEAAVYVALLELQIATAFEVAKRSGVNRSSAYVVLEGLRKKGFVGISDDKKVQRYVTASPEVLLQSAKRNAQKFEEIKTSIESILPELKALHKDTQSRPVVKVFEGKNGIVSALEESMDNREGLMRVFSVAPRIMRLLPDYFIDYLQRRVKKGIKMLGIHPEDEFASRISKMNLPKLDEPIFIPKDLYKIPVEIAIYDDKFGYISTEGEGFAIVIQSKEMADSMKSVFDLAYEQAGRIGKTPEMIRAQ